MDVDSTHASRRRSAGIWIIAALLWRSCVLRTTLRTRPTLDPSPERIAASEDFGERKYRQWPLKRCR
jgi:hypothetical protein